MSENEVRQAVEELRYQEGEQREGGVKERTARMSKTELGLCLRAGDAKQDGGELKEDALNTNWTRET